MSGIVLAGALVGDEVFGGDFFGVVAGGICDCEAVPEGDAGTGFFFTFGAGLGVVTFEAVALDVPALTPGFVVPAPGVAAVEGFPVSVDPVVPGFVAEFGGAAELLFAPSAGVVGFGGTDGKRSARMSTARTVAVLSGCV